MIRLAFGLLCMLVVAACGRAPAPAVSTDWELLGNSPEMQHHADLDQINRQSIKRLGLAWAVDVPSLDGLVGNPLIKDGVVYQSGARGRIFANDLRTGVQKWVHEEPYEFNGSVQRAWGGRYNRGLALAEGLAIVASGDCRLIAVDQKTGKKVWETEACAPGEMYSITGAPRVGGGMVFIGNSCLDSGETRGHVDAFDVKTGKHVWRFYTVPGDPSRPQDSELYEKAAKSWGTDWYRKSKGCGSAWDAMVYDPQLDQLYIGTGGPAPFTPTLRAPDAGDELFTNAIVALKAKTGEYVWHFSETPHDAWNYEASIGIMVADLPIRGETKRVVMSVPKSGFFFTLDARTGQFLAGNNYTPITWAKGLDENGRPIQAPEGRYWEQPHGAAIVLPSNMGAHGWEALAFSPKERLVYIPVEVMPTLMTLNKDDVVGGLGMDFYVQSDDPKWAHYGEIVAWDPVAQTAHWRHREPMAVNGGLLHSGELVFQGTADGKFKAFDAATGDQVWSVDVGGAIRGAPSTVMVDGEQYVIVASGNGNSAATGSYVARLAVAPEVRTRSRLLAFKLDGRASLPKPEPLPPIVKPPAARFDARLARVGESLFEQSFCVDCHGLKAESARGAVPDLRYAPLPNVEAMQQIVVGGALSARGMPPFKDLKPADVQAIYAFVINEAWAVYDVQNPTEAAARTR